MLPGSGVIFSRTTYMVGTVTLNVMSELSHSVVWVVVWLFPCLSSKMTEGIALETVEKMESLPEGLSLRLVAWWPPGHFVE